MAYTLAQLSKVTADPLKKYVIENMLRDMKAMDVLPFHDVNSLKTTALRWRTLPTVAFRDIGNDYTEDTTGDVEEVWESLYILGGLVKFDRVFGKVGNTITDPKKLIMDMKLKSLSLTWNDYFINGDLATDPLGFQGLKKRVSLMPTRQKISAGNSDSVGLNVTNSAGNVNLFWTKMEQAHRYCNGGNVQGIFCNEAMLLGFGRSLRYINSAGGNFLDVTKDSYDRQQLSYKGVPIYDMGLKKDQSTEVMADEADGAGSAAVACSVYFASFNDQQGIVGIQLGALEVIQDAKKDIATANQTLIEWVLGLAGFGSYGVTRLWNILPPASWTN
jgi:hypothetical protein